MFWTRICKTDGLKFIATVLLVSLMWGCRDSSTSNSNTSKESDIQLFNKDATACWIERFGDQIQILELAPWKRGDHRFPRGFPQYNRSGLEDSFSAKRAVDTVANRAKGQITSIAISRFEHNDEGKFVPKGWWCGFVKGNILTSVTVLTNEISSPNISKLDSKHSYLKRTLPSTWIDSDAVLKMAHEQGWSMCKNLDMSAKMELCMSDPVENLPSVPIWRTPFVTLHRIGSKDVIANVFVNAESAQVLVCPEGYTHTHGDQ